MQEHMGKKRKKELREALNLKKDRDKAILKCAIYLGGAVLLSAVYYLVAFLRIFPLLTFDNLMLSFIPLALVVAALMFGGPQVSRAQLFNDKMKRFCRDHSISKQDLEDFKTNMA